MLEQLVSQEKRQHPPDRVVANQVPRKALISHLESVLVQSRLWLCDF